MVSLRPLLKIGLVLITLVGLGINRYRWETILTIDPQIQDSETPVTGTLVLPPSLVLTTQAIGPFRSLLVNGLWWRALKLQDAGNFFESIQLASWISQLQPRLASVWTWQSWNLAWNISIQYQDPEEQRLWVTQALHLLRHEALALNPRHPRICMEIAWTFFEKIGKNSYNHYHWAKIMTLCLPRGTRDDIRELLHFKVSRDQLEQDSEVISIVNIYNKQKIDPWKIQNFPQTFLHPPAEVLPHIGSSGWEKLRKFLAKEYLTRYQCLDLQHILKIDERYGPLDWRLYHAQVVYWASPETYRPLPHKPNYIFPYHRTALVEAVYNGKLLYIHPTKPELLTTSNVELIPQVHEYLHQTQDQIVYESIIHDFHRFAIIILFIHQREDEAREIFEEYKKHFRLPEESTKMSFSEFLSRWTPLVFSQITKSRREGILSSTLREAFLFLALRQEREGKGLLQVVLRLHRYFIQQAQLENRAPPPPLSSIWRQVYDSLTSDPELDSSLKQRIQQIVPPQIPTALRPDYELSN